MQKLSFLMVSAFLTVLYSCGSAGNNFGTFTPIQGVWKKTVGSTQYGLFFVDGSNYKFGTVSRTGGFTATYIGITDYNNNTISFRDFSATGNPLSSTCPNSAGNYQFSRVDDTLTLTLINDPCPLRPGQYSGRWLLVR